MGGRGVGGAGGSVGGRAGDAEGLLVGDEAGARRGGRLPGLQVRSRRPHVIDGRPGNV